MFTQHVQSAFLSLVHKVFKDISIDAAQLSMWKGHVALQNVQFRRDLELPRNIRMTTGVVERVEVTIPWLAVHTSPVQAVVRGVRVTLQPTCDVLWDEAEVQREHVQKMRRVQAWEVARHKTRDSNDDEAEEENTDTESFQSADDYASCASTEEVAGSMDPLSGENHSSTSRGQGQGFFGRLHASVIQNLNITITDIVVEYVCAYSQICVSVQIERATLVPTTHTATNLVAKNLHIQGISVSLHSLTGDASLSNVLIEPFDVDGTFALLSGTEGATLSQAQLDVKFSSMIMHISEAVIQKVFSLLWRLQWSRMTSCDSARQSAHLTPRMSGQRSWWPFLAECVRREKGQPRWSFDVGIMMNMRLVRERYAALIQSTSKDDKEELDQLLRHLPFQTIVLLKVLHPSLPSSPFELTSRKHLDPSDLVIASTEPIAESAAVHVTLNMERVSLFVGVLRIGLEGLIANCIFRDRSVRSANFELASLDLVDESATEGVHKYLLVQNSGALLSASIMGKTLHVSSPGLQLIVTDTLLHLVKLLLRFESPSQVDFGPHRSALSLPPPYSARVFEVGHLEVVFPTLGGYRTEVQGVVWDTQGECRAQRISILCNRSAVLHPVDVHLRRLDERVVISTTDIVWDIDFAREKILLHQLVVAAAAFTELRSTRIATERPRLDSRLECYQFYLPCVQFMDHHTRIGGSLLSLRVDGTTREVSTSTITCDLMGEQFFSILGVSLKNDLQSTEVTLSIHDVICTASLSNVQRLLTVANMFPKVIPCLPIHRQRQRSPSPSPSSFQLRVSASIQVTFVPGNVLRLDVRADPQGEVNIIFVWDCPKGALIKVNASTVFHSGVLSTHVSGASIAILSPVALWDALSSHKGIVEEAVRIPLILLGPEALAQWEASRTEIETRFDCIAFQYKGMKLLLGSGTVRTSFENEELMVVSGVLQAIKAQSIFGELSVKFNFSSVKQRMELGWFDGKRVSTIHLDVESIGKQQRTMTVLSDVDLCLPDGFRSEHFVLNGTASTHVEKRAEQVVVTGATVTIDTKIVLIDKSFFSATLKLEKSQSGTVEILPCRIGLHLTNDTFDHINSIAASAKNAIEWVSPRREDGSSFFSSVPRATINIMGQRLCLPSAIIKFSINGRELRAELLQGTITRGLESNLDIQRVRVLLEDYEVVEIVNVAFCEASLTEDNAPSLSVGKVRLDIPLDLISMVPFLEALSPSITTITTSTEFTDAVHLNPNKVWRVGGDASNYIVVTGCDFYFSCGSSPSPLVSVANNTTLKFVNCRLHFTDQNFDSFFHLGVSAAVIAQDSDKCFKIFEGTELLRDTTKSSTFAFRRLSHVKIPALEVSLRFEGSAFTLQCALSHTTTKQEHALRLESLSVVYYHSSEPTRLYRVLICPSVQLIAAISPDVVVLHLDCQSVEVSVGVAVTKRLGALVPRSIALARGFELLLTTWSHKLRLDRVSSGQRIYKLGLSLPILSIQVLFPNGLPVFRCLITEGHVSLSSGVTNTSGDASVDIKAEVFTLPLCVWEPVLSFPVELSLSHSSLEAGGADQTGVQLNLRKLESAFTVPAIRALSSALDDFLQDSSSNAQGWLEIEDKAGMGFILETNDKALIHCNENSAIWVHELQSEFRLKIGNSWTTINLEQPTRLWKCDETTVVGLLVTPTPKAIKVTIHSPITLRNLLDIPLEVREVGSVAPKALLHIPVPVLDNVPMAVRVPLSTEWCSAGYSYRGACQAAFDSEGHVMRHLFSPPGSYFFCNTEVHELTGCATMTFLPCLSIVNHIGVDAIIELIADDKMISNRPLARDASTMLMNCDPSAVLLLGVTLTQTSGLMMQSDEYACVYNPMNPSDVASYIILLDPNGKYMSLRIHCDGTTITISSTTLVYNYLDIPFAMHVHTPEESVPGISHDQLIPPCSLGRAIPFVLSSPKLLPEENTDLFLSCPNHSHSIAFTTAFFPAKDTTRLMCEDTQRGGFGKSVLLVVKKLSHPFHYSQIALEFHPPYHVLNSCPYRIRLKHLCGGLNLQEFNLDVDRRIPYCLHGNGTNLFSISTDGSAKYHSEPSPMELTSGSQTSMTLLKIRVASACVNAKTFCTDKAEGEYLLLRMSLSRENQHSPTLVTFSPVQHSPLYLFNRTSHTISMRHADLTTPIVVPGHSAIPFASKKNESGLYIELSLGERILALHGMRKKSRSRTRLGNLHIDVCSTNETIFVNVLESPIQSISTIHSSGIHRIVSARLSIGESYFLLSHERGVDVFSVSTKVVTLEMTQTFTERCISAHVAQVQVDDMVGVTPMHPVVFVCPTPVPHSNTSALRLTLFQLMDSPRVFIRECSFTVGQMDLRLHDDFLSGILLLSKSVFTSLPTTAAQLKPPMPHALDSLTVHILRVAAPCTNVSVTFTRAQFNPANLFHHLTLSTVMRSVDGAPVALDRLEMIDVIGRLPEVGKKIAGHYMFCLANAWLQFLGSMDMIGNPRGLFDTWSQGVNALLQEHPLEGTPKFFRHTLGAPLSSVSKLARSGGKAMAQLSFDDEYIKGRGDIKERGKSRSEHFVSEIANGMAGVVKLPVTGAQKNGVVGFLGGVVRGVLGAVVRPTAAGLEAVASTTQHAADKLITRTEYTRIRAPITPHVQSRTNEDFVSLWLCTHCQNIDAWLGSDEMSLQAVKDQHGLQALAHHCSWEDFQRTTTDDEFYTAAHFARDRYIVTCDVPDRATVFRQCRTCSNVERAKEQWAPRELAMYLTPVEVAHHYSWQDFREVNDPHNFKARCHLARDAFHQGPVNVREMNI